MVDEILSLNNIELENSWLIGDKQSDIDLAKNSGIGSTIAIGKRDIKSTTHHFSTIVEAKEFFEKNSLL